VIEYGLVTYLLLLDLIPSRVEAVHLFLTLDYLPFLALFPL
jgi:hypothetical protein